MLRVTATKSSGGSSASPAHPVQSVPLCQMISEDIIVRASNPGQFESDTDNIWSKDCATGAIYHSGNVAINTDRANEALTVNGNIQLTGQVSSILKFAHLFEKSKPITTGI